MMEQTEKMHSECTHSKQNLCCKGANGCVFHIPKQVFHSYEGQLAKVEGKSKLYYASSCYKNVYLCLHFTLKK